MTTTRLKLATVGGKPQVLTDDGRIVAGVEAVTLQMQAGQTLKLTFTVVDFAVDVHDDPGVNVA